MITEWKKKISFSNIYFLSIFKSIQRDASKEVWEVGKTIAFFLGSGNTILECWYSCSLAFLNRKSCSFQSVLKKEPVWSWGGGGGAQSHWILSFRSYTEEANF